MCKPATSKAGNSEVYAVCSGYAAPLPRDALFSIFSAVCCEFGYNCMVVLTESDEQ